MKTKVKNSKTGQGFKGFPLEDFLNQNAFDIENILGNPLLQDAIKNHMKAYRKNTFSGYASTRDESSDTGEVRGSGLTDIPSAGNEPVAANPDQPTQSFEDRLSDFFRGLYLGNFKSDVIQADKRRPPQMYIYDIGFNTDEKKGFILRNPFDTLITFGPRNPRHPYGDIKEGMTRLPGIPKFTAVDVNPDKDCEDTKTSAIKLGGVINKTYTIAAKGDKADKGMAKPSMVCDINFRIIVDAKNRMQLLSMCGDTLKIHLSRGLIQPIQKLNSGKWVKTGARLGFDVGDRIITVRKNRIPTWGGAIDLQGAPVSITSSNQIAKLHKVNLGGTTEKPLIVFDDVEIIKKN
jgi:hypothetical protein